MSLEEISDDVVPNNSSLVYVQASQELCALGKTYITDAIDNWKTHHPLEDIDITCTKVNKVYLQHSCLKLEASNPEFQCDGEGCSAIKCKDGADCSGSRGDICGSSCQETDDGIHKICRPSASLRTGTGEGNSGSLALVMMVTLLVSLWAIVL